MLEQVNTADAAKWVLLVFFAGFIGFFGKYLGKIVILAFHKKGSGEQVIKESLDTSPETEENRDAKTAKKTMKARIKEQKKKSD